MDERANSAQPILEFLNLIEDSNFLEGIQQRLFISTWQLISHGTLTKATELPNVF